MNFPQPEETENEPLPFSEMSAQRWSVVSFDDCAASGLTYDEAVNLVKQMSRNVSGLCIVTDEAAHKMCGAQKRKRFVQLEDYSEDADKHFTEIL